MNKNFLAGLAVGLFKRVYYIDKMPDFTAQAQSNYIRLTWSYPLDNSIASVKIVRKTEDYPRTPTDGIEVYSGSGVNYNDTNVSAATSYFYRLFLYGSEGNYINSQDLICKATTNTARYKLFFNGNDTYVITNNAFNNLSLTDITVLIKCTTITSKSASILQAVPDDTSNRLNIHLLYGSGDTFWDFGSIAYNGRLSVSNANLPPINIYNALSFMAKSGTGMSIYANGTKVASSSVSSSFNATGKQIKLGYGSSNYYNGTIEEVQIWNRALSESENLFYSQYSPIGSENGLLLYYDFTEGSGTTLINKGSLGSACNGTINGITYYPIFYPNDCGCTYPYFLIWYYNSAYHAYATDIKMIYKDGAISTPAAMSYYYFDLDTTNKKWVVNTTGNTGGAQSMFAPGIVPTYTNYDVLNTDNSVWFKGNIDTNTWQLA